LINLFYFSPDFTGATANTLVWQVPVSSTWYGDFYCETGSGPSRDITIKGGIIIDPSVILEGPFDGNQMATDMNSNGLIPLTQPFNQPPWNYNGTEVLTTIPSPDIVDWVLVEMRETTGGPETATSDSIVMRIALMVRNDGKIVDPYWGTPELKYDSTTNMYSFSSMILVRVNNNIPVLCTSN